MALSKTDKLGIALLASLFAKIAKETECPPKVFVAACTAAGKAMQNAIEGKPCGSGLEWLELGEERKADEKPAPGSSQPHTLWA